MTRKRFNPEKAELLYSEERKRLLPPENVINYLDLNIGDVVETEIGPPLEDKISSVDMAGLLEQNGFNTEIVRLNEKNYGIIAKHV